MGPALNAGEPASERACPPLRQASWLSARTGGPFSTIFLKPPSLGIASRSVVTTMRVLPGIAISLILWAPAFAKPAAAPNLPLSFEPNRGQADVKTLYLARGSGYLLNLESSGLRILVRHGTKSAEISSHLIGATGERPLEALDPLPGHSSYFRGRDSSKWVTGVPTFARVRQPAVYPGIDLIYYGNQSRLEYDFVVSPGSDPRAIRMRFDGVTSLRTDRRQPRLGDPGRRNHAAEAGHLPDSRRRAPPHRGPLCDRRRPHCLFPARFV